MPEGLDLPRRPPPLPKHWAVEFLPETKADPLIIVNVRMSLSEVQFYPIGNREPLKAFKRGRHMICSVLMKRQHGRELCRPPPVPGRPQGRIKLVKKRVGGDEGALRGWGLSPPLDYNSRRATTSHSCSLL